MCVTLLLVLLCQVTLACDSAGLQQAKRKVAPSVMPLDGLAKAVTALGESEGKKTETDKAHMW